jgi:Ca-activated chloride channel family protein
MSAEFDRLLKEMSSMDVDPDPETKATHIAAAQKSFEKFQDNSDQERLTDNPSEKRGKKQTGGWVMAISKKIKRSLFLGTSGLVTAGAAMFLIMPLSQPSQDIHLVDPEVGVSSTSVKPSHMPRGKGFGTTGNNILAESESIFSSNPIAKVFAGKPSPRTSVDAVSMSAPMVMSRSMPAHDMVSPPVANNDQFSEVEQSGVKLVSEAPVSTFSVDVDTASYSTLRSYLNRGDVLEPDAVRIEEMVNYFTYDYEAPETGADPFSVDVVNFTTPWNEGTELVRIGLQGVMPEVDERPPLDLVFLIDTSGSMRAANKLGLLKQSLKMMLPQMREGDRIGIVTYAGSAGVKLEMTDATDSAAIENALDDLSAGGGTAGAAGLKAAYGLIDAQDDDRIGRVILATDGDFNVGMSSVDEMKTFIEKQRDTGAYLSVLGFGHGNYNDALMQTLAQNGNGQAAYIDTLSEARKVLVDQLSGALFPIASDVKVQVEFNPAVISEYRLIGYETRALKREDFKNDKVDAGDIGAGHQVTALYEVTYAQSTSSTFEPMRYGQEDAPVASVQNMDEIGYVRLRHKAPGESDSQLMEMAISRAQEQVTQDTAFAASIAGWGQHLKGGKYLGDWDMSEVISLARSGRGDDVFGYRSEAIRLMEIYEVTSQ